MAVDRDPYDRTIPNPNSTLGTGMGTGLDADRTGIDRTDMTDATVRQPAQRQWLGLGHRRSRRAPGAVRALQLERQRRPRREHHRDDDEPSGRQRHDRLDIEPGHDGARDTGDAAAPAAPAKPATPQ